ncbi:MAG: DUF4091 domain-containing protein [Bacilli bacterium]|nr:DUF4091 domain-containing protein [Bacilli bacterium]
MKKVRLFSSLSLLMLVGGVIPTTATSLMPLASASIINATQEIKGDQFVSVDNFLNSGLGFQMEFTFTVPESNTTNRICFMSGWTRLTNYFNMTFNKNGTVTTEYGKAFIIDSKCYFQLMLFDLAPILNFAEGATGNETLDMMYVNPANVHMDNITTSVIESEINVSAPAKVRDGTNNGLRFKSHIPSIQSGYTYGHIIVPNYYVAKYSSDYLTHLTQDGRKYLDIPCEPVLLSQDDELYKIFGTGYSLSSTIVNIKNEHYFLDYCAIPYEKSSGGDYVFGNRIKATKTNLYEACAKTKTSNDYSSYSSYGKAFIDGILNACENHPTPVTSLTNVSAYGAYNSDQVTKGADISSYARNVTMRAGRNEKEGAQIILSANSNANNKEYFVNFEPFVNSDKTARIEATNIKAYKEMYQNVNSNWSEYDNVVNDTYINGNEQPLAFGYYPDAIVPFDIAIDAWENKLDTNNGNNNGIYFTVDVPKDIPAGTYTSNALIEIKGEGTIVMPIELMVYDFTLPNRNYSNMTATINIQQNEYLYPDIDTEVGSKIYQSAFDLLADHGVSGGQLPANKWAKANLPGYIETVKKYTLDDRVSVFYYPDCYQLMSVKVKYSYKRNLSPKTKEIALEDMAIYVGKDYTNSDGTPMYGLETLFTELIKASTSTMNLLEKGIFYFPQADEPGTNETKQVQNIICQSVVLKAAENVLTNTGLFDGKPKVKESLEHVKYIVTSQPRGLLKGKVIDGSKEYDATLKEITPVSGNCGLAYLSTDINTSIYQVDGSSLIHMRGYCPQFDCFQKPKPGSDDENKYGYTDIMNYLPNDEYTMWWYGCCMPVAPFAVNFLNTPMIRYRVNKWLEYSLGVDGQLYYMANRTCKVINDTQGEVQYPCTEEEVLAGQHTYNGAFGDGVLIYPARNRYKAVDANLYWLSSLKLENWSEGNDDYNYLHYANELINRLPSGEQAAKRSEMNNCINALTTGAYYNTNNHSALYTQKGNLANLIASLENNN